MKDQGLLLFIPAYRCAPQITRVLMQLTPEIVSKFREIIVVENQSPDNTFEVAKQFISQMPSQKSLKVVKNPMNMNLGGTHKMAFQYAIDNHFSGCVILHGDDQGNIKDFEPFLSQFVSEEKFVFGARFHPQSTLVNYSQFRIFGNHVFNFLAEFILGRKIYDLGGSGLNFFPTKLLRLHHFWKYADDLTFHVFLLINAIKLGQQYTFLPITWREDDQISNARLFRQARKLLRILRSSLEKNAPLEDTQCQFLNPPGVWQTE